jgi:hypothetical protein
MSEPKPGKAEDVIGSISIPLNLIVGMAGLLISTGVLSQQEIVSIIRHLMDRSQTHGENEEMVRITLESLLAQFENMPPGAGC